MTDLDEINKIHKILLSHLGEDRLRGSIDRPARSAVFAEETDLPPYLIESLPNVKLYQHQAEALALVRTDCDTVLATASNSGKSLPFHIAAHEAFTLQQSSTLVLCPTRAVVADQARALSQLSRSGATVAALDSDERHERRTEIGRTCDILVTTPDLLHSYVLPYHQRFARVFRRLGLVHLAEVHAYRGVFGAHIASLLRRLLRLCDGYKVFPTLTATAANVPNPVSFLHELTTHEFTDVSYSSAPINFQRTVVVEPYDHGSDRLQPGSTLQTCARLLAGFTAAKVQTICYASSRENAERVVIEARRRLSEEAAETVTAYRAGYLAEERRLLDAKLQDATLCSVVATPALELGVGFSPFSVALLQGFPGSITALRERAAQVERKGAVSFVVLVTQPNALDSYFASHLDELVYRSPEWASTSLRSEQILAGHLTCAAYERPLQEIAKEPWSLPIELKKPALRATLGLVEQGVLAYRDHRYFYVPQELPHRLLSLRARGRTVHIVDLDGEIIGSSDDLRAPSTLYPGARYLHLGMPYDVVAFDQDEGIVTVERASSERRSHAVIETTVEVVSATPGFQTDGFETRTGEILVQRQVIGYRSIRPGKAATSGALNLRPLTHRCTAIWIAFHNRVKERFTYEERYCALHALEHVVLTLSPLIGLCDHSDLGAVTSVDGAIGDSPDFQGGVILLYERQETESGLIEMINTKTSELLELSYDLVRSCDCLDGCPNCILSTRCDLFNDRVSKEAALLLLELIRSNRSN